MTVARLHKILGRLIAAGHGRREVVINKQTFVHPLEGDGCCMLPICDARMDTFTVMDGDGFTIHNADGAERFQWAAVLIGEAAPGKDPTP